MSGRREPLPEASAADEIKGAGPGGDMSASVRPPHVCGAVFFFFGCWLCPFLGQLLCGHEL